MIDLGKVVGIAAGLHGAAGVIWLAISLYVLKAGAPSSKTIRKAQAILAVLVVFFGLVLWVLLHGGAPGAREAVLGVGALCAIAAAGLQHGMAKANERRLLALTADGAARSTLLRKIRLADILSALLLFIALVAMLGARGF